MGCSSLTSVNLPENLKEIKFEAFSGCSSLTSIELPNSLTGIGEDAFSESGLTSVVIPKSVTKIGSYAFSNCADLKSVNFGKVRSIGKYAFSDCDKITTVDYPSDVPCDAEYNIFDDAVYSAATLNIPVGAESVYRITTPWKYFSNIKEKNFSGIAEAIADDAIDFGVPYCVYSVSGAMVGTSVDGLAPGLYIVRQGPAAKKINVK